MANVTNDHGHVPFVVVTFRSFPHSWAITGSVTMGDTGGTGTAHIDRTPDFTPGPFHIHGLSPGLPRWVIPVEQELPTLTEHLTSPPVCSGVRVTRSLVFVHCFVRHCLSFCPFSFDHCVVWSSSIYGFRLSLWYLQTLLTC